MQLGSGVDDLLAELERPQGELLELGQRRRPVAAGFALEGLAEQAGEVLSSRGTVSQGDAKVFGHGERFVRMAAEQTPPWAGGRLVGGGELDGRVAGL